ncbi:hypothetical protein A9Q76_09385 [Arcobacter sp. 31_11_sub10_T18]|nr:hypothetical protein A9Q76_09385 [Arcobacter sp. 31_11_sub10_T18]
MIAKKYEALVFALVMGAFMSGFMSLVITYINLGLVDNFREMWLGAYWKAFVIAFPTILVVIPQVRKVVGVLVVK